MAEVLIKYKADAGDLEATVNKINEVNNEAVKSAQKASDKIATEFKDAAKSAAAAFSGGEVKKAIDSNNSALERLTKSGKSLTGQLRGLKAELTLLEQQGKDNTAEFNQLLIAASKLEDQIGDTRARVRILASDTFKFDAAVQATQGLAAGFEVAQGAAALFGSESEDLQKAILKVQGAIAVANGVQQIANLLLEESAIKTAVLTAKQAIYTTVVGTSTGALKAFRIALAATGVGLLVLGLVALVENFDKVKAALENSIPGFKTVSNAIGDVVDTIKEWVGASDDAERAGAAFEKATKRQNDATKAIVDGYNRRIEVEKAAGRNTTQLEIEREKAVIEASKKILKDYQFKSTELIKLDEEQKQKAIDAAKEARDAILEAENNILVIKTEAAKKASDAANEAAKKQAAFQKEQFAKLLQETLELQKEFEKKQREESLKQTEEAAQKQLEIEKRLRQRIISEVIQTTNQQFTGRINFLKALELEEGSSLERRIQIIELEAKERQRQIKLNVNDTFEANQLIRIDEAETQQAIRDERKKSADEQINNALEIAEQTAELFSGLLNLAKEQTQARIDQINAQSKAELDAINKSSQSEADKQRQREANELRTSRKIAAEKIKQAKLDRATALFEIGINTAIAVSKSIAASPQTFGLPFSAFAVAQGLIQAGLVLSKPLPKYKRGGMVGGKSHEAGGTLIEAERGEFVVNRNAVSRHRSELDALNTSSAAFKRLIDERYVRPALNYYMGKKDKGVIVNASLNSKGMEKKLDRLNKTMSKQRTIVNINGNDSRYAWHLN